MTKRDLFHECKGGLTFENQCNSAYEPTKKENYMIISVYSEKSFNRISTINDKNSQTRI